MSARHRVRPMLAAGYGAVALLIFAAACNTESGSSPQRQAGPLPNDAAKGNVIKARRDTATVLQLAAVASRASAQPGDAPVGGERARSLLADHPARPLINEKAPIYPARLRQEGIEGEVLVAFVVDTNGTADMQTVKVLVASRDEFAYAVRAALPEMRFDAARVNGRTVRQLIQQPFAFALSTREGIPAR